MALEIFRRVETRKGLFAVEATTLIYTLLTSVLIFILFDRLDHPWHMLFDRAAIVAMIVAQVYLYRLAPCKAVAFVRTTTVMLLLSYWYPDTYEFNRLFPNLDHVFARAEQGLIGSQPSLWLSEMFPQCWFSEAVNFGYFFYFPMMLILMLFYFFFKFEHYEKVAFVVTTSFFVYYFLYIFIPVAGPQFYFPAIGMENAEAGVFPAVGDYFKNHLDLLPGPGCPDGFFYQMVDWSQTVGERPTAAFPSSHVGISTIIMIFAWRGNKWFFAALFPVYLLLCTATVYIQAHYFIDILAGFLSAFGIYWLACKMFSHWFRTPMLLPYPSDKEESAKG